MNRAAMNRKAISSWKNTWLQLKDNPVGFGLLPALLLAFLFLMFRNAGVYPIVFIDEWIYSSGARLLSRAETMVPSYVYFALFGLTNYCGDSFMECNRLLNAALFVGAAPFIWLLARRVASPWVAVLVALAAVLAPANALTPFFMPEAAYYFMFWAICHAAFRVWELPTIGRAAVLGAIGGIAAMVKLHAIFVLPSAALFLLYAAWTVAGNLPALRRLRHGIVLCVALVGTAALVRFGVGYALAGKAGLHLFGELYASQVTYTAQAHLPYPQLAALALNNLFGQVMGMTVLFGVPVALLALQAGDVARGRLRRDPVQAMAVLTLLMLGAVVAVTVGFTASITGLGAEEVASRIHTRYYNFALPLLLLCGAAALDRQATAPALRWRVAVGAVAIAIIVYAWLQLFQRFTPNIIDSPELRTISLHPQILNLICVVAIAALAGWMARPVLGARLFLFLFLPATTLYCALMTADQVRLSIRPDPYSKAGLFVRHYMTYQQTSGMTMIADDMGGLHRARFYTDNPSAQLLLTPTGTQPDWSKMPPGKRWLLVVGKFALPEGARIYAQKDDMTLAMVGAQSAVGKRFDFTRPLSPDYVQRIDGLLPPEAWGSRFGSPRVSIQFAVPLPRRLTLSLDAHAFGQEIGRDLYVTIGGQRQPVHLSGASTRATLQFDTDGTSDYVEFSLPPSTNEAGIGIASFLIEAAPES